MFEKIVLAIDGSPSSEAAVDAAIELAAKVGAKVEVVHVHEHDRIVSKAGTGPDLETSEEASALLTGVVERVTNAGVNAHGTMRQSPSQAVAGEIISVADETGADMIVAGSRGLSALSEMVLGSVSHKLVQTAGRPVLVTHTRDRHAV